MLTKEWAWSGGGSEQPGPVVELLAVLVLAEPAELLAVLVLVQPAELLAVLVLVQPAELLAVLVLVQPAELQEAICRGRPRSATIRHCLCKSDVFWIRPQTCRRATVSNSRTCSWCSHFNELKPGGTVFCSNCHHRADVPMSDCDCPMCFRGALGAFLELPPLPVDAAEPKFDQWVREQLDIVHNLPEVPALDQSAGTSVVNLPPIPEVIQPDFGSLTFEATPNQSRYAVKVWGAAPAESSYEATADGLRVVVKIDGCAQAVVLVMISKQLLAEALAATK